MIGNVRVPIKILSIVLVVTLFSTGVYIFGSSDPTAAMENFENTYAISTAPTASYSIAVKDKLNQQEESVVSDELTSTETETSTTTGVTYLGTLKLQSDTEKAIANALQEMGYNDLAIAAFIGNFWAESKVNPEQTQIINGHSHNGQITDKCLNPNKTDGHGFAQWDTTRRVALIKTVSDPLDSYKLDAQIAFMKAELNGDKKCKPDVVNNMDLEHATWQICSKYERCGTVKGCSVTCASKLSYEQRDQANGWSDRIKGATDRYA